jgi:hypothetical protein
VTDFRGTLEGTIFDGPLSEAPMFDRLYYLAFALAMLNLVMCFWRF